MESRLVSMDFQQEIKFLVNFIFTRQISLGPNSGNTKVTHIPPEPRQPTLILSHPGLFVNHPRRARSSSSQYHK